MPERHQYSGEALRVLHERGVGEGTLNFVLAIASAVLLIALFPNYNLAPLAPVALTPLLIAAARERRWRRRFAFGYLAGVVYWFGLCNWIQWTLEQHAGVTSGVAWFLFALFCLAKALQTGVFAALAGALPSRPWTPPAVAALWVVIEYTHSWTGFEWLNLGNAASDMSFLLRLAPITGVWGLSFVFALMSAVIAAVILRRQRLASLWLVLLLGLYFLPEIPKPERGSEAAVAVQPNMDDEAAWTPELLQRTEDQMEGLSVSPVLVGGGGRGRAPSVIVWPEDPAPFYANDGRFTGFVSSVAKLAGAEVLTGAIGRAPDGAPLNSALLVSPGGAIVSRYDKVNLVPFGEFVPWPFGMITQKVSTEAGDFEPGRGVVISPLGAHRIGTFICYESVFPSYIRRFALDGAEAMFNLSNDSWFGRSQARYQHLRIVRMRAAENRRWIVRATNNGITAAIDPAGRLIETLPEYREAAARLPFGYRKDLTLYTRFGDWFVALCAAVVAAALRRRGPRLA
jgi:apolipoprotein N-acyltransferase